MGVVGFVANPASGKDVRRFAAHASVFNNREKAAMMRRCLVGMQGVCDARVRYFADSHGITESALHALDIRGEALPIENTLDARDSTRAAELLRGCDVVVSLGGDGTNRAIAKGWLDCPLIALSTGTNNAFPVMAEATTAGMAAGLIASGQVALTDVADETKVVHVDIDGEASDLALIDVVGTTDRFLGSKALFQPENWRFATVAVADPSAVGVAGVAGLLRPISRTENKGYTIFFAHGKERRFSVKAPIAPGKVDDVHVATARVEELHSPFSISGPLALAFDGERDRILKNGQAASIEIRRDGPMLVDIKRTLSIAASSNALSHMQFEDCCNNAE